MAVPGLEETTGLSECASTLRTSMFESSIGCRYLESQLGSKGGLRAADPLSLTGERSEQIDQYYS